MSGIMNTNNKNQKHNALCHLVTASLSRYQDGETTPEAARSIERHLDSCAHCTSELQLLRQVTTGVKSIPPVDAAGDFTAQAMSRIMETAARESNAPELAARPFGFWKRPSLVYSFVFVLFLVFGFFINSHLGNGIVNGNSEDPASAAVESGSAYIARVLNESQDLNLSNVQDQTVAILYDTVSDYPKKDGEW